MIELYFDAAYFWRDTKTVMALTVRELMIYVEQGSRIVEKMKSRRG